MVEVVEPGVGARRMDYGDVFVEFGDGVGLEPLPALFKVRVILGLSSFGRVRRVQVGDESVDLSCGGPCARVAGPAELHHLVPGDTEIISESHSHLQT